MVLCWFAIVWRELELVRRMSFLGMVKSSSCLAFACWMNSFANCTKSLKDSMENWSQFLFGIFVRNCFYWRNDCLNRCHEGLARSCWCAFFRSFQNIEFHCGTIIGTFFFVINFYCGTSNNFDSKLDESKIKKWTFIFWCLACIKFSFINNLMGWWIIFCNHIDSASIKWIDLKTYTLWT